jgi:hypothetical protein
MPGTLIALASILKPPVSAGGNYFANQSIRHPIGW